jgi:hypothetical protein
MKIIPQAKGSMMMKAEAMKLITQIYEEPETSFDDSCISCVYFEFDDTPYAKVEYDKIRVKTSDGHVAYWPIHPDEEEVSIDAAMQILQRKV